MTNQKKKKILTIFFACCLFTKLSFAYSYEDYELYLRAKKSYQEKNYQKAEEDFLQLKRLFPYSKLAQYKLLDFYLGLSKYYLGKEEEAKPLLIKNVLKQYEDERNYILSKIYLDSGEKQEALLYLDRLLSPQYTYSHDILEKRSKDMLIHLDPYYQNYFAAKFSKNFSNISSLKRSDVFEIAQYLSSKGEEKESQRLLLTFLEQQKMVKKEATTLEEANQEEDEKNTFFPFYEALFASFFQTKDYDKVLHYAEVFLNRDPYASDYVDFYLLQKARAYYRKKDYLRSIFCYQEIKNPRYTAEASLELASIEYSLEHYKKVIALLAKKPFKTNEDWKLLGNSYFALGKQEEFLLVAKKLQEKDPSAYENIFYQYLISHPDIPFQQINSLLFMNIIVESYLNNLYDFDFQNWNKANSLEYQKLMGLKNIRDLDVIRLEIENSQFYNISTLENSFFISTFYEDLGFYALAFQNSNKHISDFARFKNFISFLFPRYYPEIIQKYSFEYSVPEEVLNTLILISSQWDSNYEKKHKMGLFALNSPNYPNPLDLKDPEISIRLACKQLKELQKKYPGNLQLMIAFLYGEDYLKEIRFEENGDIFLSNVVDLKVKEDLQNLMLYYSFYKKLYYF